MTRWVHFAVATALALLAGPAGGQESSGFRDDFVGDRLGPEFRLLNPDPDRMAMVDGDYVLLVAHKDVKNAIAYLGALPENFELTVRFASVPVYKFQGVGLLQGEGDNTLSAGLWVNPYDEPYMYFVKQLKGEEFSDRSKDKQGRQAAVLPEGSQGRGRVRSAIQLRRGDLAINRHACFGSSLWPPDHPCLREWRRGPRDRNPN